MSAAGESRRRVVILGGGFGGLAAAQQLRHSAADVTLVDRQNHHLFQPLLYQVATGGLSPANIATPLRALLEKAKNVRVVLAEARGFDVEACKVLLDGGEIEYDDLVVATGARTHYFGHDEWRRHAPGLKTIEDARRVRRRVLLAFERAELEPDEALRRRLLTFVVVGGGPTGVELAGAVAEVARATLRGEFRRIDPASARVLLVEGLPEVLSPFSERLRQRTRGDLERLGVEVHTGTMVESIDAEGVVLRRDEEATERIDTANVLWAAGVKPSALGERLAEATGVETERGKLVVREDCSLPGHPEIFVIGDLAHFDHGDEGPMPGLAPVATQQGRYVGKLIARRLRGRSSPPFRYRDRGNMATIGRRRAVAEILGLEIAGFPAWLAWLFVHLMYLTRFENRILVLVQWGWSYITRNRSARLITGDEKIEPDDET